MTDYIIPFLAVLNTAVLGYLGYRTTRKKLTVEEQESKVAEKAQAAVERTTEIRLAVEGMADLVNNLRVQLDRERDDFTQRIVQAEADCKARIERVKRTLTERIETLEEELVAQREGALDRIEAQGTAAVSRDEHVAKDLLDRYERADAVEEGTPGEASDAASRSRKADS